MFDSCLTSYEALDFAPVTIAIIKKITKSTKKMKNAVLPLNDPTESRRIDMKIPVTRVKPPIA